MRTTRHSVRQILVLVGMGLMLAGLFGGPEASAADQERFVYQNDWRYQHPYKYQPPWGQQDYRRQHDPWAQGRWGYRYDRPSRRYSLPDRYTIHKGKKCELQCQRIRGSREYTCREYRC